MWLPAARVCAFVLMKTGFNLSPGEGATPDPDRTISGLQGGVKPPEWAVYSRKVGEGFGAGKAPLELAEGSFPAPSGSRNLGNVAISGRGTLLSEPAISIRGERNYLPRRAIEKFSARSARRLRRWLVSWVGPEGSKAVGMTLTVPGPVMSEAEFRGLFDRWRHRVKRLGVAVVWRIELQTRKQPHVHAVAWGKGRQCRDVSEAWTDLLSEMPCSYEWVSQSGLCKAAVSNRLEQPGAVEHAVNVSDVDMSASFRAWRYLAAHTGKAKQAQLGWHGRQWGVLNRRLWRKAEVERWELEPAVLVWFRRLMRRRVGLPRMGGRGQSVWWIPSGDARRLLKLAVELAGEEKA